MRSVEALARMGVRDADRLTAEARKIEEYVMAAEGEDKAQAPSPRRGRPPKTEDKATSPSDSRKDDG